MMQENQEFPGHIKRKKPNFKIVHEAPVTNSGPVDVEGILRDIRTYTKIKPSVKTYRGKY